MTYMLVSFYLSYFLSDILYLPDDTLIWVAWLLLAARLVSALVERPESVAYSADGLDQVVRRRLG